MNAGKLRWHYCTTNESIESATTKIYQINEPAM